MLEVVLVRRIVLKPQGDNTLSIGVVSSRASGNMGSGSWGGGGAERSWEREMEAAEHSFSSNWYWTPR